MTEDTIGEMKPTPRMLPIEWPEGGIVLFANNLVATSDGASSYLTFCQVSPPTIMGDNEDRQHQLEHLKAIKAQPVARLVVPMQSLREMVRLLQQQIKTIDSINSNDAPSE